MGENNSPVFFYLYMGAERIFMGNNMPQRKNIRLKDYDYSKEGMYFITICVKDRKCILSKIVGNDALVVPTQLGENIIKCWNNIEILNENISLGEFVIMPDHIHGIIIINNGNDNEFQNPNKKYGFEISERRGRRSLQGIIKDFKSVTTRIYNKCIFDNEMKNNLWQKSYYEHIIRNEKEYYKICEYITNNPLKWEEDEYNK